LAAQATAGIVFAVAVLVGGNGGALAAGQKAVTSCDTSIEASFTTAYRQVDRAYIVDEVTLSGVDPACDGFRLSVTLAAGDGRRLGEASGTFDLGPGAVGRLDFSAEDIPASDVELIAVAISS
jgi:hypothetical protein